VTIGLPALLWKGRQQIPPKSWYHLTNYTSWHKKRRNFEHLSSIPGGTSTGSSACLPCASILTKSKSLNARNVRFPVGSRHLRQIMLSSADVNCWETFSFCCRPVHLVTFGFPKLWTEETPSVPATSPEIRSENIRSIRPAEHVSKIFRTKCTPNNLLWQIPTPNSTLHQLIKKFPAFCGNWKFFAMFTRATRVQSTSWHLFL